MKSKKRYTATYTKAKYVGNHPYIRDTDGVYYWNSEQCSFIFRPNTDAENISKTDWFRVSKKNLVDLE